jgi:hypothetical protein
MDTLVSAGAGLLGTLVGAAIAWLAGRRQRRLEMAFGMHREFHAPEMTHSRNMGGSTVRAHHSQNYNSMRRNLTPDETQHVWNVMYFYQRLWLAIKYGNIYKRHVPEMFGENFTWWYLESYETQLVPLDWQASRHVAALMKWIEDNADEVELARWRERARRMDEPTRGDVGKIGGG